MRKVKYYKCPECGKKFKTLGGWGEHVQTMHPGSIPENFTVARYFYFTLTGKTAGSCIMCKSPTQWNESTGKYDRFCTNPKCKQEYVKIAKKRMRDKYGKEYLLNDPEMQRKMLAAKHISGEYSFSDGSGKLGYVGTYEKDFLMMMDKFMRYSATDIIAPSPHTYYYEYQGSKHFYIPDFYIPNLNLEIEIKAQDNTHPKIQAIDKVKEKLKDEMMMSNPKINYLKINDKNYNNFFEYLLNLKDQIDDRDVSPSTKNSAEFKAATESAFDYYENTEVPEYESVTESIIPESKTEDLNPVIVVFSSFVNPLLRNINTYIPDRFNSFGIVLRDSSDPYGFSLYSIEPSAKWLYEGYPISCYFKKQSISEVPQGANMMSIVTYVTSDEYNKIQKRVNNPEIIFTGWSELLETWFSHSDRYRFFCNRMISTVLNEDKPFESRDYILMTISNPNPEMPYWEDLRNKLLILENSPMGPARERQAFEEAVLEESLYGYLPEEMEYACECAFSGWEDAIHRLGDNALSVDADDEATESLRSYVSHKNWEFNMDKWKPVAGNNVLYITGYSGSGKTTYAKSIANSTPNAVYVDTDLMVQYTEDKIEYGADNDSSRLARQFFKDHKGIIANDASNDGDGDTVYYVRTKYVMDWIEKYSHAHPSTLLVVEGIWMMYCCSPEYFRSKPIIVMGTSIAKSEYRRALRDGKSNKYRRNKYSYTSKDKIRKDFVDALSSYASGSAKESAEIISPAEESLLLKTKFNKVKIKGTLSLTKFTRQDLTQEVLDKYKEKCASFGHCRISNMSKGYLYTDKSDNIVGFVNVVRKPDNIKWIQALNIQPHYQGYGLYEQLMKVAVRELGGTDIETPPKNDTAKLVYKKFGFRTYTNETTRHAMTIRSDAKAEKYDAKAKPNATTIVEAGLHPVYIMLADAKTGFGGVIKFFTNAPYSHALIGFDSSMKKMYSFATRDGHTMVPLGFTEENIETYAKKNSRSKYVLYVKLVDSKDYKLMKQKLHEFTSHKADFNYDIGGAVKAYMGKHNANEKRYFCSGFVAYILNSGQSKVTEKDHDLTKPMDLTDVKNIHLVDMGLCKDFNQAYVEKKTKQIFEKHYMHKEKDSHHQPIDEEEELKKDKKDNNEEE